MKLQRALMVLLDAKVDFIVIGGTAMSARGSSHVTYDLDICYSRGHENLERIVGALVPHHPRLRVHAADALPFLFDVETLRRGMNFRLSTDLGNIDLLGEVTGLGDYQKAVEASSTEQIFGHACAVLTLDGLIRSKRAAGRPRDLQALMELEALRELEGE